MANSFCSSCEKQLQGDYSFCPNCGAKLEPVTSRKPDSGGSASPLAMSEQDPISRLGTFARVAKIVALLGFFLPWVTVSCAGEHLASISGATLATGTLTVRNPITGMSETHNGSPDLLVWLAVLLLGVALFAGFKWTKRRAATAGLRATVAAALLLAFDVFIRIPAQLRDGTRRGRSSGFEASMNESMGQLIRIETASGFWLVLLTLVAAAFMHWTVRKRLTGDVPSSAESTGTRAV